MGKEVKWKISSHNSIVFSIMGSPSANIKLVFKFITVKYFAVLQSQSV